MYKSLDRACHGGPCTEKGMAVPGFCQCKADADRIAELEAALQAISAEMKTAHDGACVGPVKDILHNAGFKQWADTSR